VPADAIITAVDVDAQQRARAVERFVTLGGLTAEAAEALVDAALAGAIDHALESVNGMGPVPTQMAASRADHLRFVCERAGRILNQREVEILFRVSASTARTILTTLRATYEQILRDKFVAAMQADVTVAPSGNDTDGLTWTLRFTEPGPFLTATSEVGRLGLAAVADVSPARRTITIPRRIGEAGGKRRGTLSLLGLPKPAP